MILESIALVPSFCPSRIVGSDGPYVILAVPRALFTTERIVIRWGSGSGDFTAEPRSHRYVGGGGPD